MSDGNEKNTFKTLLENIGNIITLDNVQKYVLGNKKSGQPRALYDLFRDHSSKSGKNNKKKKNGKGKSKSSYAIYLRAKKGKKKKKNKHWHI